MTDPLRRDSEPEGQQPEPEGIELRPAGDASLSCAFCRAPIGDPRWRCKRCGHSWSTGP